MKCLLDRRDRAALAVAEGLGWPMSHQDDRVEVDLPDTWAAQLAALMAVFGEGMRQAAEGTGG